MATAPHPPRIPTPVLIGTLVALGLGIVFATRLRDLGKSALKSVVLQFASGWVSKLPEADRTLFEDEIEGAIERGDIGRIKQLLSDWEATAEASDSEELLRRFAEPVTQPGPEVPRSKRASRRPARIAR